ncbi:glycosyl hydrolase family 18 protein [Patescibacteria group bacterium]|nr:glycosyl hydrolase family 18 protein [Patescibacteria group bacterium]MCL5798232.1 glycosyl hydrolase family 18 protein [Patescibacteria group bacterium]
MTPKIIKAVLVPLISGIIAGILIFFFLPKLPLSPDNPLYSLLGIRKMRVIGFEPYWLLTRSDKNYTPYLTDLTYFGLNIGPDGHLVKLANTKEEDPSWTWFKGNTLSSRLKTVTKDGLTTTLLLFNANEKDITALLSDPLTNARNMMDDAVPLMAKYGYKNLNLDIESFKEASAEDKIRFTEFVHNVKNLLKINGKGSLIVDFSPSVFYKNYIIDPAGVAQYADFVIIMAYDYNYSGSFLTGPVAPLSGAGINRETDVESAIKDAKKIIPENKIVLGIPLYGYEWDTLLKEPGIAAIPNSSSVASNNRITKLLSSCKTCTRSFDIDSMSPYIIYQEKDADYYHQIYFEDKESLEAKLQVAEKNGLAGVALWALGYEGNDMLSPLSNYKKTYLKL